MQTSIIFVIKREWKLLINRKKKKQTETLVKKSKTLEEQKNISKKRKQE